MSAASSEEPEFILYDSPERHVARITLNRPNTANAQSVQFLYELNDAFDRAAHDDDIKVIILAANGKHFSSGHDLREPDADVQIKNYDTVGTICGFGCAGAEAQMSREEEQYLGFSERWRNIPKPTIAVVQGQAIAGALMLVWPCDLIIASDDAVFVDPTVSFGVGGVEFFHHAFELPQRKAKEMLFTGDAISADEALSLGMINKVVSREQLENSSLEMARKITNKSRFALKLTKKAINGAYDAQGREVSMNNAFHLHQLAHTHWLAQYGFVLDPMGLPDATRKALGIKEEPA